MTDYLKQVELDSIEYLPKLKTNSPNIGKIQVHGNQVKDQT